MLHVAKLHAPEHISESYYLTMDLLLFTHICFPSPITTKTLNGLYIWVTRRLSYKKQEILSLCEHMSSPQVFWWSVLLIFQFFVVVILCVFTFWVPSCDVRYDFRIKLFSVLLYLQLYVGGLMFYLRYFCLFVYSGVQHILCCVFVFLRLVYPMLPVSLDCPLFDWPFDILWIVHFWLTLRHSLTFIYLYYNKFYRILVIFQQVL